ncbi:MAG: hypothetical protein ACR2FK_06215 [Sphingomicrobium sp.]
MRIFPMILPLALAASPALAQTAPAPATPGADALAIPPEFYDPRTTDRLIDAMHVMSKAFLDLPVGEIEAALSGRQPTAADRTRTVRSESRMTEQQLKQEIEQARPALHAGRRVLTTALPSILGSMARMGAEIERELERATANLPQPGYPKR